MVENRRVKGQVYEFDIFLWLFFPYKKQSFMVRKIETVLKLLKNAIVSLWVTNNREFKVVQIIDF